MINNNKIYVLIDPNTKEYKYIGQTKKELYERLAHHLNSIFRKKKFNDLRDWLKNLLINNQIPIVELLEDNIDDNDINQKEKNYVQKYSLEGHILYNIVYNNNIEFLENRSNLSSKNIYQYSEQGDFIKEWKSLTQAAEFYNISNSNICSSAMSKRNLCGGFQWKYYKLDTIPPFILKRFKKKVYRYDKEGNYIDEHESGRTIPEVPYKLISKCCNGDLHTVYGFRYSFEKLDKLPELKRKKK